jgi:fused signal recognition particle receptor
MFEQLKKALSSLTSSVTQKTLSEKEVEMILSDFKVALLESDVAHEVVEELASKIKETVVGIKVQRSIPSSDYVKEQLLQLVKQEFLQAPQMNVVEMIRAKKSSGEPFIIVFLGINGTGKTTTVAKFAYMLKQQGLTAVLSCADTHRAGAIEQLNEHAERLSVKAISQRYGADPAAVARDAVTYAKNHYIDVVLVDTAGRMQTSRNLMEEVSKIVRVVKPDLKVFVGDALAGNDAVSQAKQFLAYTGFDAAILTKVDADVKGGAALSITHATCRPIICIGVGQTYDSLVPFNSDEFVSSLFT